MIKWAVQKSKSKDPLKLKEYIEIMEKQGYTLMFIDNFYFYWKFGGLK